MIKNHSPMTFFKKHIFSILLTLAVVNFELTIFSGYLEVQSPEWVYVIRTCLILMLGYSLVFSGHDHYKSFKAIVALSVFSISIGVLVGTFIEPRLIDDLAKEDAIIENLSALFLFIGSLIFLIVSAALPFKRLFLQSAISFLAALVLFVIGMEEISWMQRVIGFESSEFFLENNMQNEVNLHNLNTALSTRGYFFGAFLILVLIPFFKKPIERILEKIKLGSLTAFLPSSWLLIPFSVMVGFDAQNGYAYTTVVLAFVITLFILLHELINSDRNTVARSIAVALSMAIIITAWVLITFIYNYDQAGIRFWFAQEYRELLIALGLVVYAVDLVVRPEGILSLQPKTKK